MPHPAGLTPSQYLSLVVVHRCSDALCYLMPDPDAQGCDTKTNVRSLRLALIRLQTHTLASHPVRAAILGELRSQNKRTLR